LLERRWASASRPSFASNDHRFLLNLCQSVFICVNPCLSVSLYIRGGAPPLV
jgi:hypothetical protein